MFRRAFTTVDSETDGRSIWVLAIAGALLLVWLYWFTRVPVRLYTVSVTARVEIASNASPVDVPISGRVSSLHKLTLGESVKRGELLVKLDPTKVGLERSEAKVLYEGLGPQLEAIEDELEAERAAAAADGALGTASIAGAVGRLRAATVARDQAAQEMRRLESLFEKGVASRAELERGQAAFETAVARVSEVAAEKRQLTSEHAKAQRERQARIAALDRERVRLESNRRETTARLDSLTHEVELHEVRASATGHIGSVEDIRVGAVVNEGTRIATIISDSDMRIVSEFLPQDTFGRLYPGQKARVEFEGFPWVEYGRAAARVEHVATEVVNGRARVELVFEGALPDFPLQHGQPARVTIATDRATPLQLLLRLIGRRMTAKASSSSGS